MSFIQKVRATANRYIEQFQAIHDRKVAAAEAKTRAQLAKARTKTEKEKIKLQLKREKLVLQRELYEAKTATRRAQEAVVRARKEAGDVTLRERIGEVGGSFGKGLRQLIMPRRRRTATKTRRKS